MIMLMFYSMHHFSFLPSSNLQLQHHTNRNATTTKMLQPGRLAANGLDTKMGTGNRGLETQMRLESFGMFFFSFFLSFFSYTNYYYIKHGNHDGYVAIIDMFAAANGFF